MIRTICAWLLLTTSTCLAGPFGLEMGMSRETAGAEAPNSNGFSGLPNVPEPHPNLIVYSGKFASGAGLCAIIAASKDFENDRYGESVREAFDAIRLQVDNTYGPSQLFDNLRSGALWDDYDEWVMAVPQNERSYQASWDRASGAKLKDGIAEILLTVRAFDATPADYALQYRFENDSACNEELSAQGQSVL